MVNLSGFDVGYFAIYIDLIFLCELSLIGMESRKYFYDRLTENSYNTQSPRKAESGAGKKKIRKLFPPLM